jgi:hypothetical protein
MIRQQRQPPHRSDRAAVSNARHFRRLAEAETVICFVFNETLSTVFIVFFLSLQRINQQKDDEEDFYFLIASAGIHGSGTGTRETTRERLCEGC